MQWFKGQPPLMDYALWEEVERLAALVIFHPGAIQGKEGIKFCHLATLVSSY